MINWKKQIIILISLILFLLSIIIITAVNAESPRQSEKEATHPQQNTANNHRGSDQSPLIVKILPTIKNNVEAENETKEKEEKATNDKRIIQITGILAVIGFLQLIVFGLQARRLRQTVEVTKEAANATTNSVANISKIERAYVFVTVEQHPQALEPIYEIDGYKGYFVLNANVRCWNLGRTPAVITKIRAIISFGKAIIPEIEESDIPSGIVVGSDKWKNITAISPRFNDIERQNIYNLNTIAYCCGRIEYQDVFYGKYIRGFCWEFGAPISRPNEPWIISAKYKDLNYEKEQKEGG